MSSGDGLTASHTGLVWLGPAIIPDQMEDTMKVLFAVGFGPIVPHVDAGQVFYKDVLGLPLKANGSYLHSSDIEGVKEFALWPLSEAAQSCFGTDKWPEEYRCARMARIRCG